jgi:glycosyltransferase involved in cell wall biosynthesis
MKKLFRLIDSLVVSSTMEKELYAKHFDIPEDIIDCVLWGVAEPEFTIKSTISEQPYISAVGGNARDYQTFMSAMSALPELQAIAVMRPENMQGLVIPPNVNVLTNIPFGDALSIIKHSMFTVLPLVSTETPCGHVTLVIAMYLGVPCVITDSTGIEDYIEHGKTGLMCQQGSSESLIESINLLSSDENLRQQIAKNGEQFVRQSCTESNYVSHLLSILERK